MMVESQTGSNSINAIHMMTFQQESLASTIHRTYKIPPSNAVQKNILVVPKKEPLTIENVWKVFTDGLLKTFQFYFL